LIGKAKSAEYLKKFNVSIDVVNEILVYYPTFVPALIEKALVKNTIYNVIPTHSTNPTQN
jgi:hypothetical protein